LDRLVFQHTGTSLRTATFAQAQEEILRTDLRLRTQLLLADRFDRHRSVLSRRILAQDLVGHAPHDQIRVATLNFFEDLGLLVRRGFLDEELAWSTFGFHAIRWWMAALDYIGEQRRLKGDDSLFDEFQTLVNAFRKLDAAHGLPEPSPSDLNDFLLHELNLKG
jgi:hypothetical protein